MAATVATLPSKGRRPSAATAPYRGTNRASLRRQRTASAVAAGVAVVLTGLSLVHLAQGIHVVTRAGMLECWAMGVGIDAGFLAAEGTMLCASTDAVRRKVARYAGPAIIGTLTMSALLNALAFAAQAKGGSPTSPQPWGFRFPPSSMPTRAWPSSPPPLARAKPEPRPITPKEFDHADAHRRGKRRPFA